MCKQDSLSPLIVSVCDQPWLLGGGLYGDHRAPLRGESFISCRCQIELGGWSKLFWKHVWNHAIWTIISVGADHKLHDGLDNEGERGHGHEDRDEGFEKLHEGDGGGVPQQDHLRLPECDKATLHNPLDNQRTGTKGLVTDLSPWSILNWHYIVWGPVLALVCWISQ